MHGILAFLAGILLYFVFQYFPFLTVFFGIVTSAVLFLRKKPLLVLLMVCAAAYAYLRCEPVSFNPTVSEAAIRCVFETYPEETVHGFLRQTAHIKSARNPATGDSIPELRGRRVAVVGKQEFALEKEYGLLVSVLNKRQRLNPGTYADDTMYASLVAVNDERALTPNLYMMLQEWRHRVHSEIRKHFRGDSAALLGAITIGHRGDFSVRLRESFSVAGLAHILSISGTHFGLFSAVVFALFRLIIRVLPHAVLRRMTLYLSPAQAAAFLSFPFMIAYLGLSGGSTPAVRSFIMIGLFLFGLVIGRRGFWLNSLLFAALVIVLWKPESVLSLSFQLSFLAVLFIGFAIERDVSEKGAAEEGKLRRYIRKTILLTLAAALGTAPLFSYSFHYASLISPVSNLIVTPLIGFLLIPMAIISAFIFLATGYYPFAPIIGALANASLSTVNKLSEIPYASITMPAFPLIIVFLCYSGFLFYRLRKENRYFLLLPFLAVVCYGVFSMVGTERLSATFLDVGQGDSAVVELPDGKTLVIDTGTSGREVASFLAFRGKKHIDALVLSHVHPDHTGGIPYIRERFHIREVWHSSGMTLTDALQPLAHRALERGDLIEGNGYRISVLHPYSEFYTSNGNEYVGENNDSLVLRVGARDISFLFAGDIEEEAAENIVHLGKWLASDVIKVPHHGGRTSAYGPLLTAVDPDIAVISAERDNRFGHPHKETLDMLLGRILLRTDRDGAIKIEKGPEGYAIKTHADFRFQKAGGMMSEMRNIERLFQTW